MNHSVYNINMKRFFKGISIVLLLTFASNFIANARVNINVNYDDLAENKIINLQPKTKYSLTFTNLPTAVNYTKLIKDFSGKVSVASRAKAKTNNETVHPIITLRTKESFEGPVNLELYSGPVTGNGQALRSKDLGTLLETIELTFKINS